MDVIDLKELDLEKEAIHTCLICLELTTPLNRYEEELNLFFNHLQILKIETSLCKNCGENVAKFVKLCNNLEEEKVRLEVDYLLDFIQNAIALSNQKYESTALLSVRDLVAKKCGELRKGPKAEVILQKAHQRLIHSKKFPCTFCQKTFKYSSHLENHVSSVHKKRRYICPVPSCSKFYSITGNLVRHYRTEHDLVKKPFQCPTCLEEFKTRQDLRGHVDATHLKLRPFNCDKCDKSFPSRPSLRRHKLEVHEGFLCEVCGEVFDIPWKLSSHKRTHKGDSFPCGICNKIYTTKQGLQMHVSTVHEKRRYNCPVPGCYKDYSYQSSLIIHYREEHERFQGRPFKCPTCLKEFKTRELLRGHVDATHLKTGIRAYNSDKCDNSFLNRTSLTCKICGVAFSNKLTLRNHKRTHKDEKFPCEICKIICKSRQGLQIHVSGVHDKQRFHCKVIGCYKSYSQASDLRRHYRVEHPKKVVEEVSRRMEDDDENIMDKTRVIFICEDCDYKKVSEEGVQEHTKRGHKITSIFECKMCHKHFVEMDFFKLHFERCLSRNN